MKFITLTLAFKQELPCPRELILNTAHIIAIYARLDSPDYHAGSEVFITGLSLEQPFCVQETPAQILALL